MGMKFGGKERGRRGGSILSLTCAGDAPQRSESALSKTSSCIQKNKATTAKVYAMNHRRVQAVGAGHAQKQATARRRPKGSGGVGKKRAMKKKSRGSSDRESRRSAYFYAQGRPIYQLLADGELEWETIGEYFFAFSQKNKDGKEK